RGADSGAGVSAAVARDLRRGQGRQDHLLRVRARGRRAPELREGGRGAEGGCRLKFTTKTQRAQREIKENESENRGPVASALACLSYYAFLFAFSLCTLCLCGELTHRPSASSNRHMRQCAGRARRASSAGFPLAAPDRTGRSRIPLRGATPF